MRKVTTKKGDTWETLLLALGSSKPWVSRSLRPWLVSVRDDRIFFCFGKEGGFGRDRLDPLIRLFESHLRWMRTAQIDRTRESL